MQKIPTPFGLTLLFIFAITQNFAQGPQIIVNPMGHSSKVSTLQYAPDGRRLISVSEDKTIRIWNTENGALEKRFESQIGDGPEGMFYASALSPDGKLLAVAGYPVASEKQNYIIVIDIEKGTQVATALGHDDIITCLSFNGSGKYLASGSSDNTVKLWKVDDSKQYKNVATFELPAGVSDLSINSQTNALAVGCDKDIWIYDLARLETGGTKLKPNVLKKHKGTVIRLTFSPDGAYMVSSSNSKEVVLWRSNGTVIREIDRLGQSVTALAFSSDSQILAGMEQGSGKGTTWRVADGTILTEYTGHDNTVSAVVFSPGRTGNYSVASAGGINNEILLWSPVNGMTLRKIKSKGSVIHDLSFGEGLKLYISRDFTRNGRPQFKAGFDFATLSMDRNPSQINPTAQDPHNVLQSSEYTLQLPKARTIKLSPTADGRILHYRVLPNENVIIAADYALKMFDKEGSLLKEFVGHSGPVMAVTLSSDAKYLASGGTDQSIILWNLNEAGEVPTVREAFKDDPSWQQYLSSLPYDSLTRQPTRKAWITLIDNLKANGDKSYKGIEEVYKNLGEIVVPFATLFLTDDNEWVCWTPKGYFSCSPAGSQYFGWHINRGIHQLADFYEAEQYFEILYRPNEVAKSIVTGKRVEDILRESGQRIFDLGKLQRPSAVLFEVASNTRAAELLQYDSGKLFTRARVIPLTVAIFDGGGGIKKVSLYQNDKLIKEDEDFKVLPENQKILRTYDVEMVNETNEFKVKVTNFQKIESRTDKIAIEYTGDVFSTTTLHVLSIGINTYENVSLSLNYAQPDAKAFSEKISEHGQKIFKSIITLPLYDEEATKENIVKAFKTTIERAKPDDVFLFFYAGHGTIDESQKDENGNSPFYFVPTNVTKLYSDPDQLHAKGLSGAEFQNYLTQIKCRKQVIITDACHSGAILKGIKVRSGDADERAIVQLARSSGVAWLASSGSKQFATEFEELGHGVFTYALLEALDGKAANGDGKITVNELKVYMEERVPELTKKYGGIAQYPTGHVTGNDFPLSVLDKP